MPKKEMKNLLPQLNYSQKKRAKFSDSGEFFLNQQSVSSSSSLVFSSPPIGGDFFNNWPQNLEHNALNFGASY